MEDALLVGRAVAGDLDSFGQLYDRYLPRVYDFAWRTLRDADAAAEATRHIFQRASRELSGMPKGGSFRAWLFAIAYGTVVPLAEAAVRPAPAAIPSHEEAFGAFDVPDPCRLDDPAVVGEDYALAALVWEAACSLAPRDYATIDLHLREGLDSAELAAVTNADKGGSAAIVARLKSAAADVLSGYVLARRGGSCAAFQQVLAGYAFPPYTDGMRRAVEAHVKECGACQRTRKLVVAPIEIFGAFAPVQAPLPLKGDLWRELASAWNARSRAGADAGFGAAAGGLTLGGAGGDGPGGGLFTTAGGDWDRQRIFLFVGAAAGLLLVAFAGALVVSRALGGGDTGGGGAPPEVSRTARPTSSSTPAGTLTPGVSVQTPTPNLTPSVTPTASVTPTPTPQPPTPTSAPATSTPPPTRTPSAPPTSKPGATPKPSATPKPGATP